MKYLARVYFFSVFALWLTTELLPGFVISGNTITMLGAGLALSLLTLIVKPVLKILFIPVNVLSFGLLSWLVYVIMIYLLTVIVPEVKIVPFTFAGLSIAGFVIPAAEVSYLASLILSSVFITFVNNVLHTISE